jgi:hypothetical protein
MLRFSHWLYLACSVLAIEGVKTTFRLASLTRDPYSSLSYDCLDCDYMNWTVALRVTALYVTYFHLLFLVALIHMGCVQYLLLILEVLWNSYNHYVSWEL